VHVQQQVVQHCLTDSTVKLCTGYNAQHLAGAAACGVSSAPSSFVIAAHDVSVSAQAELEDAHKGDPVTPTMTPEEQVGGCAAGHTILAGCNI
jgi:hypothetical protein